MKKTLIALSTAAVLAVGFSATAKADGFYFGVGAGGAPHFGVAIGGPGYGYGGYGYHHYNAGYYGDACGPHFVKKWVWNQWHTAKFPVIQKVWSCY